jgi:DNA-binding transcriptional MerR regulator
MVLATLVFRARAICDEDSLGQELEFLKNSLKDNGYSLQQIQQVLSRKEKPPRHNRKPILTVFLPYVQSMSSHLNRMLRKHDFRGINLPPKKIFKCLRPVKDNMGLKTAGVYCIPCKCGNVYVGQSGCTTETRVEEH